MIQDLVYVGKKLSNKVYSLKMNSLKRYETKCVFAHAPENDYEWHNHFVETCSKLIIHHIQREDYTANMYQLFITE